jgi:hypothetical protein
MSTVRGRPRLQHVEQARHRAQTERPGHVAQRLRRREIALELGAVDEDAVPDAQQRAVDQRHAFRATQTNTVDPPAVARARVFEVQRAAGSRETDVVRGDLAVDVAALPEPGAADGLGGGREGEGGAAGKRERRDEALAAFGGEAAGGRGVIFGGLGAEGHGR